MANAEVAICILNLIIKPLVCMTFNQRRRILALSFLKCRAREGRNLRILESSMRWMKSGRVSRKPVTERSTNQTDVFLLVLVGSMNSDWLRLGY